MSTTYERTYTLEVTVASEDRDVLRRLSSASLANEIADSLATEWYDDSLDMWIETIHPTGRSAISTITEGGGHIEITVPAVTADDLKGA